MDAAQTRAGDRGVRVAVTAALSCHDEENASASSCSASETLRALRALDDKSLMHVVGGGDAPLERETRRLCTLPAIATVACNG